MKKKRCNTHTKKKRIKKCNGGALQEWGMFTFYLTEGLSSIEPSED